MTVHKDLAGTEIKVGDYLVQAFNLGRCAALKFAKVIKLSESSVRLVCLDRNYEWRLKHNPDCSPISKYSIQYPEGR